jgi:hypothetical protein
VPGNRRVSVPLIGLLAGLVVLGLAGIILIVVVVLRMSGTPGDAGQARLRDRLVGTWEATLPGGSATLQFNRDGTLVLTMDAVVNGQRRNVRDTGRWSVVREEGERLTVTRRTDNLGVESTNELAFAGPDTFTIQGEGGGLTYRRRR